MAIVNLPSTIKLVAFTGGEPFLIWPKLPSLIKSAKNRGFRTRVVTSAYFGKSPSLTTSRLNGVLDAGLDELSISWDDFHEEFVSFSSVRAVYLEAKRLGLDVAINAVQTKDAKWTAERIKNALGEHDASAIFCDSSINLTGRAEKEISKSSIISESYIGPCPYVITGPTLSAKGKLLACCGVIQDTPHLSINDEFLPETTEKDVSKVSESTLFKALHYMGPYKVLEMISRHYNLPCPTKETIGGNCEACKILFHDEPYAGLVEKYVADNQKTIEDSVSLISLLGLDVPKSTMYFLGPKPSE